MKYTRKFLIIMLCACMTLCTFIPVSAEERTTRITSVKLSDDGKEITVEATLSEDFLNVYGACGVYLFELAPYEKFSDIDRMAPVAELVANANLTFSVDITDGSRTRKYDKFAIARLDGGKYITHGSASYVVISADVKRVCGEFRVFSKGGREDTGMEAVAWLKRCVGLGAGEVVLNSIDTDGVKGGFDLEMLDKVCSSVDVPVIASGGAGKTEDFIELFEKVPRVDAGLAASVFHFGEISIPDLKAALRENNIQVRL